MSSKRATRRKLRRLRPAPESGLAADVEFLQIKASLTRIFNKSMPAVPEKMPAAPETAAQEMPKAAA
jgi:hypothetical protein